MKEKEHEEIREEIEGRGNTERVGETKEKERRQKEKRTKDKGAHR